jgi:hypothetical protein
MFTFFKPQPASAADRPPHSRAIKAMESVLQTHNLTRSQRRQIIGDVLRALEAAGVTLADRR